MIFDHRRKTTDDRRDLIRDERGQALLFAAASIMILVGFIAVVYNLGRITERRTAIQLAADDAAWSGATVQANSLSTIAWANNGLAQIYTTMVQYAVDVCITGVAAEMEHRKDPTAPPGPAGQAYIDAVSKAAEGMPAGKTLMLDLSRIENAVALVTPRLMQETMIDAAKANGAERVSVYPTTRLYPHPSGSRHYRIEQFTEGWRITNLDTGEMLWVYKLAREWHIVYSNSGIIREEVVITETEPGKRWVVCRYDGAHNLVQVITLIKTDEFGWIVLGSQHGEQGVNLTFTKVDMDGDGIKEGTQITDDGGHTLILMNKDGDTWIWDRNRKEYVSMTTQETTIGGIPIKVNVTNVVEFPGATIRVGDPTTVDIGNTHIVLTDPPTIETGMGGIVISVHGFDAGNFSVAVNGFVLNIGTADGRWRTYFNPDEELWWRHRLTEQPPIDRLALRQWQYDYEVMGALLAYEPNRDRFAKDNGILARGGAPTWMNWFDVTTGQPLLLNYSQEPRMVLNPRTGLKEPPPNEPNPPPGTYYRTYSPCPVCRGAGYVAGDMCPSCHACDYDSNGVSDIRVFLVDVLRSAYLQGLRAQTHEAMDSDWMTVQAFAPDSYGVQEPPRMPLVLSEEFFKYGVNVAAWRSAEKTPMLFPNEPAWGFVGSASARVGLSGVGFMPGGFGEGNSRERALWVSGNVANLYQPDIEVNLVPMRRTLTLEDLHQSDAVALNATEENGLSYLFATLLVSRFGQYDEPSTWIDEYGGRTERDVPRLLTNMRQRSGSAVVEADTGFHPTNWPDQSARHQGGAFDLRDASLDEVVLH